MSAIHHTSDKLVLTVILLLGHAAAAPVAGAAPSALPEPAADYRAVVQSTDLETYSRAARAYRKWLIENDPHRPLYHFTGVESWINDPNGPIYHDGRYHLFYQFDPQVPDGKGGWTRSQRCWGHAVSDDLVRWDAQVWKKGDAWWQIIGGATEAPKQGAAWLWTSKEVHPPRIEALNL